jgi:hypothetical protein
MIKSIEDFWESSPVKFGSPKGFTRNNVQFYSIDSEKYVLKTFENSRLFENENDSYDLLKSNGSIFVPFRHFSEKVSILYSYIQSEIDDDPLVRLSEWGRIHSDKDLEDLEGGLGVTEKVICRKLERIASKIKDSPEVFGENSLDYLGILSNSFDRIVNPSRRAFIHSDLRRVNSSSTNEGIYYFDFEFSGLGSPLVDVATTVLENPERRNEIVESYSNSVDFDFGEVEKDLGPQIVFRGCDVLYLHLERSIPQIVRDSVRERFTLVMDNYI